MCGVNGRMLPVVGSLFAAVYKNNNCILKERVAWPRLQKVISSTGTV
jgi:hypothetical protein